MCIQKNSLLCRARSLVFSWGSALFFLYFFYPIKFLHTIGSIKNGLSDNISISVFNVRNAILFCGILVCSYCFLKKDNKKKTIFFKVFLLYASLLTVMFLYSYFKHVFMPVEIIMFSCVFLPSTFFSTFLEEETFVKMNKILCWGLLIFFCFWQTHGCFWVSDYLGFFTLLLLSLVYTLTKNLKIFYLLYILFNVYIFFQFEKKIGGGVGQILVIYISVFAFLIYKKYYRKLGFCLCCMLAVLIYNNHFSFFYNVVMYKTDVRIKLIENKPIENKPIEKNLLNLFLITPYKGPQIGNSVDTFFRYPHNAFIEAYMVFGFLGLVWYLTVNMISFAGLKRTEQKYFFIIMFLSLTLLSLKQGSILSQKLLILFHVFGIKMFFSHKNKTEKTC